MKIIDSKKDYYDYVSGIYGIDEKIVYDRRGSIMLGKGGYNPNFGFDDLFFSDKRHVSDKGTQTKYTWTKDYKGKFHFKKIPVGEMYYFVLEVGNRHYYFSIERYLDDEGKLVKNIALLEISDSETKISSAPLAIIPCRDTSSPLTPTYKWYYNKGAMCENPLLLNTFIPKYITAENIWQSIADYISSLKNINHEDTRTDVQKLESFGFDKKTSFRHPIK